MLLVLWILYLHCYCLSVIITLITNIVNLSLSIGVFPSSMKVALVCPLIKKLSLDHDSLKNYRPVSNLPFISKVIERAVTVWLNSYIKRNVLDEPIQSAYKASHSTETALLCVSNDIRHSIDKKKPVLLVLLDNSATFDTVEHQLLIARLQHHMGVTGLALNWFTSYLSDSSN